MDNLIQFVPEQLLILVAALYVIGIFLKGSNKIKDNFIPWILLVLGIGFSICINGIRATAILQGVICTGVSVLSNQLKKQTIDKKEE